MLEKRVYIVVETIVGCSIESYTIATIDVSFVILVNFITAAYLKIGRIEVVGPTYIPIASGWSGKLIFKKWNEMKKNFGTYQPRQ